MTKYRKELVDRVAAHDAKKAVLIAEAELAKDLASAELKIKVTTPGIKLKVVADPTEDSPVKNKLVVEPTEVLITTPYFNLTSIINGLRQPTAIAKLQVNNLKDDSENQLKSIVSLEQKNVYEISKTTAFNSPAVDDAPLLGQLEGFDLYNETTGLDLNSDLTAFFTAFYANLTTWSTNLTDHYTANSITVPDWFTNFKWNSTDTDHSFLNDNAAMVSKFLEERRKVLDPNGKKIPHVLQTVILTLDGST